MILAYAFCFLGVITLVLSLVFAVISIGFRRSNTSITKGYLKKTNHRRNVYVGGKSGRWYKNWLDYSYSYRVDDKQYTVSGGIPGKPDNIKSSVTVIYQKNHPDLSYIQDLTFPIQAVIAVLLFVVSSGFLIPGIILLIDSE